jgi:hypothetical protein
VATGDVEQRSHLCGLPVKMHRYDRLRARRDGVFDSIGIDVVGARVDVYKDRSCSALGYRLGGGEKGERGRDHFVTRSDAQCLQREPQSPGPGGEPNGALRPDKGSECPLKPGYLFTENEARVVEDSLNGRINLGLDAGVLCFEVYQGYLNNSISFAGDAPDGVCRDGASAALDRALRRAAPRGQSISYRCEMSIACRLAGCLTVLGKLKEQPRIPRIARMDHE